MTPSFFSGPALLLAGKNTQTSLLLVSSGMLRRVDALMVSSAESPQLLAEKVRTIFPKRPSLRPNPQRQAPGSMDMDECRGLRWQEVHGFCAQQCRMQASKTWG